MASLIRHDAGTLFHEKTLSIDLFQPPTLSLSVTEVATEAFNEKQPFIDETETEANSPASTSQQRSDSEVELDIRAKGERLLHDLEYTAQWGAIKGTLGIERLTLSDEDKCVRDWFVQEAKDIGCHVKIDGIGNIFAVLPGEHNDLAPIAMGSHLDTQPGGGRYDGILGVLAGLEVLRSIKESGQLTYTPVAVVVWTNEEGSRFNPGCTGSAVWSGWTKYADALQQSDSHGTTTMGEQLLRIGYAGEHYPDFRMNPLSAHFELHIEQGNRLEKAGKNIGAVCGAQGNKWYIITVTGKRAHAGSTPMLERADAVVAAAEIIQVLHDRATELNGFATVGRIDLDRPSSNTISGLVSFTVDLRHDRAEDIDAMERCITDRMDIITKRNPDMHFSMEQKWHSPAVRFDDTMLSCIRAAASAELGFSGFMDLDSRAGHDSVLTSACGVPTAMIFVPSRDGLSHCPEEYTSDEQW